VKALQAERGQPGTPRTPPTPAPLPGLIGPEIYGAMPEGGPGLQLRGFADIDFGNESLRGGLLRHGAAVDEPTFFSWLGVTMYLEEDAIDAVLRSVAGFPRGSEIVLTFASLSSGHPSPLSRRTERLGEPWVSYFEPDAIEGKLRGAGFSKVEFLSPGDARGRYFLNRGDGLSIPETTNIVSAVL